MREEFKNIISGWTLVNGFNVITEKLEELAPWVERNKPLESDEEQTLELMIQCQIARGFEEGVE